jgi:hypothetical protein
MYKVDHPHGGGRGKSKGNRHPVSPWGVPVRPSNFHEIYIAGLTHFSDQEWLQDPSQAQQKQVGCGASTSKQRKAPRQGQLRACLERSDELTSRMKSTCQIAEELGASALYIMTLHCTICDIIDEGVMSVPIREPRENDIHFTLY